MSKPQETAVYTHGHHESVLRSHTWRTAANSAAYLLDVAEAAHAILDIGCGPGTITADLAELVPDGHVTGVDHAPACWTGPGDGRRAGAAQRRLRRGGRARAGLPRRHLLRGPRPPGAPARGRPRAGAARDAPGDRPGGFIAVRDADYAAMTWYPADAGPWTTGWSCTGGWPAPTAANPTRDGVSRPGRWQAGHSGRRHGHVQHLDLRHRRRSGPGGAACGRTARWPPPTPDRASEGGHATADRLRAAPDAWRGGGAQEDGWFAVLHGEVLCRKREDQGTAVSAL